VLGRAEGLYGAYGLRRVYYSAFSPIPDASARLPPRRPPLMREHRLYQADWLMRFYGFSRQEIVDAHPGGMLDLELDPKLAWALAHRDKFPIDVNRADKELLLRTPGLGAKTVDKILATRRHHSLSLSDLARLAGSVKRLKAFVVASDWRPTAVLDAADLAERMRAAAKPVSAAQLSLF
jgi:predicted DNA-binding helix-hairpin-helix protein